MLSAMTTVFGSAIPKTCRPIWGFANDATLFGFE
jgi:hypothetical protein